MLILFLLYLPWLMYYDGVTRVIPERIAMPIHQVELTSKQSRFISKEVKSGRYRDEREVLEAGLKLLEQKKQSQAEKLKTLRALAKEGFDELDQGLGIVLHSEVELRDYIRKLGKQASAAVKRRSK